MVSRTVTFRGFLSLKTTDFFLILGVRLIMIIKQEGPEGPGTLTGE